MIAQHLDMVALWRGEPGEHSDKAKPVPAPDVPRTELAAYEDGPLVWQRYFGTNYPTEGYLLSIPPTPIADVDGDGTCEIICTVGGRQWELRVYDGMTGDEKLSLADAKAEAVFDLDGDGTPEIVARIDGELVIGSLKNGRWIERLRLPQCKLGYTKRPAAPDLPAGPHQMAHAPVSVDTPDGPAWVGWQDADGNGRADALVLLRVGDGDELEISERPLPDNDYVSVLAGSGGRLIAVSADGQMHVLDAELTQETSWPCGSVFVSEPVVADIDGDGRNEVLVYRAEQTAVALRVSDDGTNEPREVWSVEAGEPPREGLWPNVGGGLETPLCADVTGDGKKETLLTCRLPNGDQGTKLLGWRGETVWETALPLSTATFGDLTGDGRLDVYGAGIMSSERGVWLNGQSFALDGRDGSILWHNDGSDEILWHHHAGPSHRGGTVFDVNGDGCEDIIFTALDLCGVLNGRDGTLLHTPVIANEIWDQRGGEGTHWPAYGLSVPVDLDGDGKTEIFLTSSWGQWGAWSLHRELLWTFDPGKDNMARRAAGIGDVDGDGRLEFGVVHDDHTLRCYDAATGEPRWVVEGVTQVTDVVTADVDGDGLPEFLTGLSAYKATGPTSGKLLWRVEAPVARSPVVADIDGDGLSELLVTCTDGRVRAYG